MPDSPPNRTLGSTPDAGQITVKGCECESGCAATIDDGFKCDWCTTKHGCGHSGLRGHWDYCSYPDNKTFEETTFQEKNVYFWNRITADKRRAEAYAPPTDIFFED